MQFIQQKASLAQEVCSEMIQNRKPLQFQVLNFRLWNWVAKTSARSFERVQVFFHIGEGSLRFMDFVEKFFSSLVSCLNYYDQVGEIEDLFRWEVFK